jgi:hypothetical protein
MTLLLKRIFKKAFKREGVSNKNKTMTTLLHEKTYSSSMIERDSTSWKIWQ